MWADEAWCERVVESIAWGGVWSAERGQATVSNYVDRWGGQGLVREVERGHPGAAVHRHSLDRLNVINDSFKKKRGG